MEVLLLLVMAMANIICFMVGAKVGQAVSKGEDVKLPTLNPVEIYKTHKENKAAEAEMNRLDAVLQNLESYNGTEAGQQDIPRG
jgi:hypothetical protein